MSNIGLTEAECREIAEEGKAPPVNLNTTDGMAWAKEFIRVTQAGDFEVPKLWDEGFLVGWFANAIERGRTAGREEVFKGLPYLDWMVIENVIAERARQVAKEGEGFDAAHDDQHDRGQLVEAAMNYAGAAQICTLLNSDNYEATPPFSSWQGFNWPWDRAWWKPGNRRRMLIKAIALLLAEVARLDRLAAAAYEAERRDMGEPV